MMIKTTKILVATVAILLTLWFALGSCVKNKLYENTTTGDGGLMLTTDWSLRTAGIAIPATYTVQVDDSKVNMSGTTNTHPARFSAGTHRLRIYHPADKITIDQTIASVATTTRAATTYVDPTPGWLFSAKADVVIVARQSNNVSVMMKQEICELNINLTITRGDPSSITSVVGTLSGVAMSWNLDDAIPVGSPVSVEPVFVRNTNKITTSMRLLGVMPSVSQNLTLVITFADGSQQTIVKDLSTLLVGFNTDQYVARSIAADIELSTAVGFNCTITNWTMTTGQSGTAQ